MTWAVASAMAVGAACAPSASARATSTSAREAVQAGAVLLDVRTPAEFADGHLQGALNIPVDELANRSSELPDRAKQYVVYCRSGRRSAAAAQWLRTNGYPNVIDLGAMSNWDAAAPGAK